MKISTQSSSQSIDEIQDLVHRHRRRWRVGLPHLLALSIPRRHSRRYLARQSLLCLPEMSAVSMLRLGVDLLLALMALFAFMHRLVSCFIL